MRYCVTILFLLFNLYGFSQPEWKCLYSDSVVMKVSDSAMQKLADDMRERDMPDAIIEAIMQKMVSGTFSTTRTKYIMANADSTLIHIEVAEEGSLRLDASASQYLLLKQDELYYMTGTGYYDSVFTAPRKVFISSNRQPVFFNYTCREYISTDSTCTIWVAEELPSCINPGIRTGGIKGAVLFYELKSAGGFLVRCRISSIKQGDKKN